MDHMHLYTLHAPERSMYTHPAVVLLWLIHFHFQWWWYTAIEITAEMISSCSQLMHYFSSVYLCTSTMATLAIAGVELLQLRDCRYRFQWASCIALIIPPRLLPLLISLWMR